MAFVLALEMYNMGQSLSDPLQDKMDPSFSVKTKFNKKLHPLFS